MTTKNLRPISPASRHHRLVTPVERPRTYSLLIFLAAVFVVKLVVVMQLKDHVLTQADAGLDTPAYVALARRVLAGDMGLGPGLYFLSPLSAYFLAAVLAVTNSFTAVRLLQ